MAELKKLSVYIGYDELLTSELRAILRGIETSYNQVDSFLSGRRRVSTEHRLRVASIHTGGSLEAVLTGSGRTIVGLVLLIQYLHHRRWTTAKVKWDAKLAERQFKREENQEEEKQILSGLQKEDHHLVKTLNILQKIIKQITRSSRIVSIEIKIVVDEPEEPKRRITFADDASENKT